MKIKPFKMISMTEADNHLNNNSNRNSCKNLSIFSNSRVIYKDNNKNLNNRLDNNSKRKRKLQQIR